MYCKYVWNVAPVPEIWAEPVSMLHAFPPSMLFAQQAKALAHRLVPINPNSGTQHKIIHKHTGRWEIKLVKNLYQTACSIRKKTNTKQISNESLHHIINKMHQKMIFIKLTNATTGVPWPFKCSSKLMQTVCISGFAY